MSTYRQIIQEIVPTHAIAEAERRTYDQPIDRDRTYVCADGMCALGAMWSAAHPERRRSLASDLTFFDGQPQRTNDRAERAQRFALRSIVRHNDAGNLAAPGSLTGLLDRECAVVIA